MKVYPIIFTLFRMQPSADGLLDSKGKFGLTTNQIYYLPLENYSDNDIQKIVKFFDSEEYKILQKTTTTGQFLKDGFIKSLDINKIIGKKSKPMIIENNSSDIDLEKTMAAKKIKSFITKKHREHKNKKTKSNKSGGKKSTKKYSKKKS